MLASERNFFGVAKTVRSRSTRRNYSTAGLNPSPTTSISRASTTGPMGPRTFARKACSAGRSICHVWHVELHAHGRHLGGLGGLVSIMVGSGVPPSILSFRCLLRCLLRCSIGSTCNLASAPSNGISGVSSYDNLHQLRFSFLSVFILFFQCLSKTNAIVFGIILYYSFSGLYPAISFRAIWRTWMGEQNLEGTTWGNDMGERHGGTTWGNNNPERSD